MIKIKEKRKVAVLEGENAIAHDEELIRICNYTVDFLQGTIRVVVFRGVMIGDIFTITNPEAFIIEIGNEEDSLVPDPETDRMVVVKGRPLFNELMALGKDSPDKWEGDFTLKQLEEFINDKGLLKRGKKTMTVESILDQD